MDIKKVLKRSVKYCLPYGMVKVINKDGNQHPHNEFTSVGPEIYSAAGERLRVYYLQSRGTAHMPYAISSIDYEKPKKIFWDRYNYYLKTHFYMDDDIFSVKEGCFEHKFAMIMEPPVILPDLYKKIFADPAYMSSFEAIFTSSVEILERFDNAYFVCIPMWYGGIYGGTIKNDRYLYKTKNISMIASNKVMCAGHYFRQEIARKYKKLGIVDCYGRFDGGKYVELPVPFDDYRYQIVIENEVADYMFTEKILNCFAAMTVPIYVGAGNIGDFFNIDGIIQVNTEKEIDEAVHIACRDDYELRLNAIKDNFKRCQEYIGIEDYIWNHYRNLLPK